MKYIVSGLFVLLIIVQFQVWFGNYGLFQLWSLRQAVDQQQQKNLILEQRNKRLHAEVEELKQGKDALEGRAREQLGFIKEGETFYRIIPRPD